MVSTVVTMAAALFIRRIIRSDRDATPTAVRIDYDALIRKQSIQSRRSPVILGVA